MPEICQGIPVLLKIGWDEIVGSSLKLVITLAQVPQLTISPSRLPFTYPILKRQNSACAIKKNTHKVLRLTAGAFSKHLWRFLCSGNRNSQLNELKKDTSSPNTGDQEKQDMTNSHRKNRSFDRLWESIIRSWQIEVNENKRRRCLQQFISYFMNCETC